MPDKYTVSLSASALASLRGLRGYVQADYSPHGSRWYDGLDSAIRGLQWMPNRGRLYREPNIRSILYGRRSYTCRITYRVNDEDRYVEVLAIRHCRQRPDNLTRPSR
ncbi:Plasmid stabilization system protein [Terriglobus roseus DSM 18391]|uniref:Plasmid stabilization system protein n=1 Tax=Terriglobus roseus (strain DSM 18391 / NRRL B-41598 / KBS 63) TaxID=926566 RepID=I3ZBJ0_TERRK|nr:Plasmid stabilization system protein [Terriglobus roseus DSM 18391]